MASKQNELERLVRDLNELLGKPIPPSLTTPGCLQLDTSTTGYRVVEIVNGGGGQKEIVSLARKSAKEMKFALEMAIWAVQVRSQGR